MQLSEAVYPEGSPIDGYGPGFFRVAGQVHEGALLVTPNGVITWGGFEDTAAILGMAADLDVVLVGVGADMRPLPSDFQAALTEAGIGVEPMNSPTACRTYNVLLSEGRRIGLALIPI